MNKIRIIILVTAFIFLIGGCFKKQEFENTKTDIITTTTTNIATTKPRATIEPTMNPMPDDEVNEENLSNLAKIHIAVYEALFEVDSGLNKDMEYININFVSRPYFSQKEKDYVIKKFSEKYGVPVYNKTSQELKDEGLSTESGYFGIGMYFERKTRFSATDAVIDCFKYKNGMAAVSVTFYVEKMDDKWVVIETVIRGYA